MLETTDNALTYVVTGDSRVFQFPLPFFEAENIHCYLGRGDDPERELERNTDFTVAQLADYSHGADVTFAPGVVEIGDKLAIVRIVPLNQLLALPNNGKLPSRPMETQLDRMEAQIQQLAADLWRCFKVDRFGGTTITVNGLGVLLSSGGWSAYSHRDGSGHTDGGHIILGSGGVQFFCGVSSATINNTTVDAAGLHVRGVFEQADAVGSAGPDGLGGWGEYVGLETARADAASGGELHVHGWASGTDHSRGFPGAWVSSSYDNKTSLLPGGGAVVSCYNQKLKPEYELPRVGSSVVYHKPYDVWDGLEVTASGAFAYSATVVNFEYRTDYPEQDLPPYYPDDLGSGVTERCWDASLDLGGYREVISRDSNGVYTGGHVNWEFAGQGCAHSSPLVGTPNVWFSNPGYYVLQYLDTSGFAINDDDGTVTLRLWNHSETLYPNDDGEYPFVLSGTLASPSGTTIVFTSGAIVDSANYVNQVIVSGAIVLNSSGRKREYRWHNDARVSNGHFLLSGGQVTSSDEDQFVSSAFGKVEYAQARASIVCGGRLSSGGSEIVHEEELSLAAGGIYYKVTAGGVTKQGNLLDLVNAAANNQ